MTDAGPPVGAPPGTVGRTFLEEKLIHRSTRGDLVSSKSELVIADLLFEAEKKLGIRYFFERVLIGENGRQKVSRLPKSSGTSHTASSWQCKVTGAAWQRQVQVAGVALGSEVAVGRISLLRIGMARLGIGSIAVCLTNLTMSVAGMPS
jgi:hypothetical protein